MELISFINDRCLGYFLIAALLGAGFYFTVVLRFVQFVRPSEMLKLMVAGADKPKEKGNISPFQAFSISTASRVGTGNIAGVAIAITTGGPGAIFWMWLIALFGAASAFAESTLAQIYKVRNGKNFHGGPAYYIRTALNNKPLAIAFSVSLILTFPLVFNSVQANTIAASLKTTFQLDPLFSGLLLAALTAAIIFGGLKRVAKFSAIVVPVFALGYIAITVLVVLLNLQKLPAVFLTIVQDAFSWQKLCSGALGAMVMVGARRGLFSNEAGMGSAPNAAATAHTSHPIKQGYVQAFSVFLDTLIICSCTAFLILLSDYTHFGGLEGIALTQRALETELGAWGNYFISASVLLFAFTSIIGNYYYGQANIEFLSRKKRVMLVFRLGVSVMILLGAVMKMQAVWSLADLCMTFMALINIYALFRLRKIVVAAYNDYCRQRKEGKNPVFHPQDVPEIQNTTAWD